MPSGRPGALAYAEGSRLRTKVVPSCHFEELLFCSTVGQSLWAWPCKMQHPLAGFIGDVRADPAVGRAACLTTDISRSAFAEVRGRRFPRRRTSCVLLSLCMGSSTICCLLPVAQVRFPTAVQGNALAEFSENGTRAGDRPVLESISNSVDYVIDHTWIAHTTPRMHVLATRREQPSIGLVSRLLVPRYVEDMHLLRLLSTDQLRVEFRPLYRSPQTKILVRVLTDAFRLLPSSSLRSRRQPSFFGPRRQWLLFAEVALEFPAHVSVTRCRSTWRWAGLSAAETSASDAVAAPFRVLEIECPLRSQGILLRLEEAMSKRRPLAVSLLLPWIILFAAMLLSICANTLVTVLRLMAHVRALMRRM